MFGLNVREMLRWSCWLICIYYWAMNLLVVASVRTFHDLMVPIMMLRVIGIFVPPIGIVLELPWDSIRHFFGV